MIDAQWCMHKAAEFSSVSVASSGPPSIHPMHAVGCVVAAGLCLMAGVAAMKKPRPPALANTLQDPEQQQCIDFLRKHMPSRDRRQVTEDMLLHHAQLGLKARRSNAWAAAVPWDIFLNDVLPYRNLDEPIDIDWRSMFFSLFSPMVANAGSLTEAAQILNRDIWKIWDLHFVPDKSPEIMSPGQVLAAGYASCTGLSIFLADACRAVGVPARVAGTPSWVKHRRDSPNERFNNHNWVEIWDGNSWSFTGACEYNEAGLNRTWFFPQPAQGQIPGDRWHAIYAASYKQTGVVFPLAWAPKNKAVPGVDVTRAYIDAVVPSAAAPTVAAVAAGKTTSPVAGAVPGKPAAVAADVVAAAAVSPQR